MGVLYFLAILAVIITTHELGHLLSAKFFNVYCKEFSFGMGPKLFSYKGKETTYNIRLFPVGGFVSMAGENDVNEEIPHDRSLKGISPFANVVIMLSGVAANFLLAWGIMVFVNVTHLNNLMDGLADGSRLFVMNSGLIYGALTDLATGTGLDNVTGPVGLITITQEQANFGFLNLVYLTGIISLNVAIFNALPLPILDGGRVVIVFFETLLKRPLNQRLMKLLFNANAILLLVLLAFVMWKDVVQFYF